MKCKMYIKVYYNIKIETIYVLKDFIILDFIMFFISY